MWDRLPVGVRFCPTEEELVGYFLVNRISNNRPLEFDGFIKDYDVYTTEPWNLPNSEFEYKSGNEAYYYTERSSKQKKKRKQVDGKGKKAERRAGEGWWKVTGVDKDIADPTTGKLLGHISHLSYYRAGVSKSSGWVMNEFRLPGPEFQRWTICRIKPNASAEKRMNYKDGDGGNCIKKLTAAADHYCDREEGLPQTVHRQSVAYSGSPIIIVDDDVDDDTRNMDLGCDSTTTTTCTAAGDYVEGSSSMSDSVDYKEHHDDVDDDDDDDESFLFLLNDLLGISPATTTAHG